MAQHRDSDSTQALTACIKLTSQAMLRHLALALFLLQSLIAQTPSESLNKLFTDEWAWREKEFLRSGPNHSLTFDKLPSATPAAQQRRLDYWSQCLTTLNSIPTTNLTRDEKIDAATFRTFLEAEIAGLRFKTYEAPFNSDTFFWTNLTARQPYRSAAEYRNLLGRMKDLPRYFNEHTANMRSGLARGYSVPYVSTIGREKTIEAYTKPGPTNPFFEAFNQIPDSIPAAEREQLKKAALDLISDSIAPAYIRLLTFFRDEEYQPKTRRSIDAHSLPDGEAFYRAAIKEYTTLDLTADQIHQIGLQEVARIRADMEKTINDSGFKGTFAQFLTFLRTDPQFYAKTPRELLSYVSYITKRVDGQLKNFFQVLPRYRHGIIKVPDAIAPIYTAGRGGLENCLFNTYDLPSRPLYNLPALTVHECTPGHSFQAALALEAPQRPEFRRHTYFSSYGEGWGLYTEWLGTKMGVYETPYEEFGRQTFEMWRAARLVIDTGIHAQGWTRQQAIDYLSSNTALAKLDIVNEIDRYIAWPAQALSYKLGELKIREMRSLAEKELGAKFDQRLFHDLILNLGAVPLPVLESELRAFIESQKLSK